MQDERFRSPANSSKNSERMLLASYVAGLVGVVGRQVRYLNPVMNALLIMESCITFLYVRYLRHILMLSTDCLLLGSFDFMCVSYFFCVLIQYFLTRGM
jgi:hypothetical protein